MMDDGTIWCQWCSDFEAEVELVAQHRDRWKQGSQYESAVLDGEFWEGIRLELCVKCASAAARVLHQNPWRRYTQELDDIRRRHFEES